MITTTKTHTLVRSHDFEESEFGIDQEDISFVIDLLRNQIYSNKPLAVVREYTTNAVDAHAEVGKEDLPIKVTLPTKFEPTFKVRDFGTGLTDDEIRNLYTRYCKSTKRNSNAFTGQLGIGCKAGFAYGDNFGIISYNNGVRNSYNAQIDETAKGKVILLDSTPTTEKNGMEIVISIADNDVDTFRNEALNLFRFFKLIPEIINLGEDKIKEKVVSLEGKGWKLYQEENSNSYHYSRRNYGSRNQTIAIMGNIGYPIDYSSIQNLDSKYQDLLCLDNLWVEFEIGDLNISPSREGLEYTKHTQQAIKDKIELIKADLEEIAKEKLGDASDYYEAKCNYASIINSLPHSIQSVLENSFTWKGISITSSIIAKPRTDWQTPEVIIRHYWKEDDSANSDGFKVKSKIVDRITCHQDNLLGINDCPSNHGLALKARTLFKDNENANNIFMIWFKDDAWKKKFYDERSFEHVDDNRINYFSKIDKSSSGYVSAGGSTKSSQGSRQHVKLFKLKSNCGGADRSNWDDVEKDAVPTTGVYIPILRYGMVDDKDQKVCETATIARLVEAIKEISGLEIDVYGIRRTDVTKHGYAEDSNWTHLNDWIKSNSKKIWTSSVWQKYVNELYTKNIAEIDYFNCDKFVNVCKKELSDSHILRKGIKLLPKSDKRGNFDYSDLHRIEWLLNDFSELDPKTYTDEWKSENKENFTPELTKESIETHIEKNYPMLGMVTFYSWRFEQSEADKCVQYIQQIDKLNSKN